MRQSIQSRFGEGGVQRLDAWLAMLERSGGRSVQGQLQAVNDFWNQNVVGGEDQQIWGEAEYWGTPLETLGKRAGEENTLALAAGFAQAVPL